MVNEKVLHILGTVAAAVGLVLVFIPSVPVHVDLAFVAGGATGVGVGCLLAR